jgi:hypothetical protein
MGLVTIVEIGLIPFRAAHRTCDRKHLNLS